MRKFYSLTRKEVPSSVHTENNIEIVDEKDAKATSNINLIFIWFILWYHVTLQIRTVWKMITLAKINKPNKN